MMAPTRFNRPDARPMSDEEALKLVKTFCTSAEAGEGVKRAFEILEAALQRDKEEPGPDETSTHEWSKLALERAAGK